MATAETITLAPEGKPLVIGPKLKREIERELRRIIAELEITTSVTRRRQLEAQVEVIASILGIGGKR